MPPIPKTYTRLSRQLIFAAALVTLVFLLAYAPVTPVSSMGGAGTGPGGVGATDGSGTLEVWYQSDKTVYSDTSCTIPQTADNSPVACWPDHSGKNNNATQSVSGSRPTLQNVGGDTLNSHPMLRWDGGNDFLGTSGTIGLGPFTVFVVFNATNVGFIYEHNVASFTNGGSYLLTSEGGTHSVARMPGPVESWRNLSATWGTDGNNRIVAQTFNGTNASHNMYINGALQTTVPGNAGDPGLGVITANLYIGDRGSGTPVLPIAGNYAEFFVYSEALNSAQRLIISNYLQAKFNDSAIDNILMGALDLYSGDTTANGNFDMDVAGIGQEADGSHTEAHSAGMIVQNGTFLDTAADDGDYLIFGHRTATNNNVTTDLPLTWNIYPDAQRWERHWEISVTDGNGDEGTVTIIFDFTEGGMDPTEPPVGPASNYYLLGRSSASGDFAEITQATSISTTPPQVIFADVDVSLLNSNFTLATIDATVSPTVVEMQSAAANTPSTFTFLTALTLLTLGAGTVLKLRRRV